MHWMGLSLLVMLWACTPAELGETGDTAQGVERDDTDASEDSGADAGTDSDLGTDADTEAMEGTEAPPPARPAVELSTEWGGCGESGGLVTVEVIVSDEDTSPSSLSVQVEDSVDGQQPVFLSNIGPDPYGVVAFSRSDFVDGEHVMTAHVTNHLGLSSTDSVTFTVGCQATP